MQFAEIQRLISNLIRYVSVVEVDDAKAKVRVSDGGDFKSDWVEVLVPKAGTSSVWTMPSVDEVGLLLSPNGNISLGVFLSGLFDPSDAYLKGTGDTAVVKSSKTAIEGDLTIRGDVIIDGTISATGKIHSNDDLTTNTVTVNGHKHINAVGSPTPAPIPEPQSPVVSNFGDITQNNSPE